MAISLGTTFLLHEVWGTSVELSFALSLVVTFIFHFIVNAFFVFRSGANWYIWGRYVVSALVFRGADFVLFEIITRMTLLYYPVAIFCAILISNTIKFFVYSRQVFVHPQGQLKEESD